MAIMGGAISSERGTPAGFLVRGVGSRVEGSEGKSLQETIGSWLASMLA